MRGVRSITAKVVAEAAGVAARTRHHLYAEWPAAVLVAALVSLAHNAVQWVNDVDVTTYVAAGQLSLLWRSEDGESSLGFEPKAWVYALSAEDNRVNYRERTPLDRCELFEDLDAVYRSIRKHNARVEARSRARLQALLRERSSIALSDSERETIRNRLDADYNVRMALDRLAVLVVDLDLSPVEVGGASDSEALRETGCQQKLDALIAMQGRQPTYDAADGAPIRTVLVDPHVRWTGDDVGQRWRRRLESVGVLFGSSEVQADHRTVVRQSCDPFSLPAVAVRLVGGGEPCLTHVRERLEHRCAIGEDCGLLIDEPTALIDPYKFAAQVEFRPIRRYLATVCIADDWVPVEQEDSSVRAAFFGVNFGRDVHMTGVGSIYGVDLHAGRFLSFIDRPLGTSHAWSLWIDIAFSLVFGTFLSAIASKSFAIARSTGSNRQPKAAAMVLLLVLSLVVIVFLAVVAAAILLRYCSLWSSPIPILLGLLLEQVLGLVHRVLQQDGQPDHHERFFGSVDRFFVGRLDDAVKSGTSLECVYEVLRVGLWLSLVILAFIVH